MEKAIKISLNEGTYILPLIVNRINELRRLMSPVHSKEIPFRGVVFDEITKLEEIQHKLIELYSRAVKVS